MTTTITSKGQVTVPKTIRDALGLRAGAKVEFAVNSAGEIVLTKAAQGKTGPRKPDRFDAARGKATIKWNTDELMALLRGEE